MMPPLIRWFKQGGESRAVGGAKIDCEKNWIGMNNDNNRGGNGKSAITSAASKQMPDNEPKYPWSKIYKETIQKYTIIK